MCCHRLPLGVRSYQNRAETSACDKCVKTFQCSPFPSVKGKTCETRGYVQWEGRCAVTGIPTTAASASRTSGRTTSWRKRSGRPNDSGRFWNPPQCRQFSTTTKGKKQSVARLLINPRPASVFSHLPRPGGPLAVSKWCLVASGKKKNSGLLSTRSRDWP